MRRKNKEQAGAPNAKTQRETLRDVLLCAAQYDTWMTLEELAHKTRYAPASISAQLRHLRKAEHGGFVVEKRRRKAEEMLRQNLHERVWEYQMRPGEWIADGAPAVSPEVPFFGS